MYPEEYSLTESIADSDFHSSTSGEEELEDSEDEDACQLKLHYKITEFSSSKYFLSSNLTLKQKESL